MLHLQYLIEEKSRKPSSAEFVEMRDGLYLASQELIVGDRAIELFAPGKGQKNRLYIIYL